ncbi:MAG: vitamin K epoxide reductase family protein [Candidatus Woesearchaeota archaeon]|jgi:uncharacterized membrane protein
MIKRLNFWDWTILVLVLLEVILSGVLVYQNLNSSTPCLLGQPTRCSDVQGSSYGTLFGIKLPYLALFAFIGLLVTYFINSEVFFLGTIIGAAASAYLILVQIFVLKEACSTCLMIDSTMIVLFVTSGIRRLSKSKK